MNLFCNLCYSLVFKLAFSRNSSVPFIIKKNGQYKCTTQDVTGWNSRENARKWRKDLADTINAVNDKNGLRENFWEHPSFRKKSILMGLSDETDSLSYKEISCGQPNPRQSDAGGGTGISFVCVSLCHTSDPYEDDGPAETDSGSGRNCGGRDQPVCIQCLAFGKGK